MLARDLQAWRIAADPVAYHHRWRHAQQGLTGNRRSAVNAAMAAQHALVASDGCIDAGPLASRLIASWNHLEIAAELVAMAKQPCATIAHPDFIRLPASMRQFMRLGFAPAQHACRTPMSRGQLQSWGAGYILEGLAPCLPYWLAQRLALPFPSITEGTGVRPQTFDHSCFWSSLSHAQTVTVALRHPSH